VKRCACAYKLEPREREPLLTFVSLSTRVLTSIDDPGWSSFRTVGQARRCGLGPAGFSVWPIVIAPFYVAASQGGFVEATVLWNDPQGGISAVAEGPVEAYSESPPESFVTTGLRGTLDRPSPYNVERFQPVQFQVEKVGPENATASVKLQAGPEQILDDPIVGQKWTGAGGETGWFSQDLTEPDRFRGYVIVSLVSDNTRLRSRGVLNG
jgi:hypothetical protein